MPWVGTAALAIGWGLLGDRWLGFLLIPFVAWGDSAAGLARVTLVRSTVTRLVAVVGHGDRLSGRRVPLPALVDWRCRCDCGDHGRPEEAEIRRLVGR